MSKYKIGDKVKVKSYEELKKMAKLVRSDGSLQMKNDVITSGMIPLCGKEVTIDGFSFLTESYVIKNEPYLWYEDWFEEIEPEVKTILLKDVLPLITDELVKIKFKIKTVVGEVNHIEEVGKANLKGDVLEQEVATIECTKTTNPWYDHIPLITLK